MIKMHLEVICYVLFEGDERAEAVATPLCIAADFGKHEGVEVRSVAADGVLVALDGVRPPPIATEAIRIDADHLRADTRP